jgi:hypothetical protein
MNTINKIPRPVQILIVIAILAILVWRFAPTRILYPSIIAAGLVTLGASAWIYRSAGSKLNQEQSGKEEFENAEDAESQDDSLALEDDQSKSAIPIYSKVSSHTPRLQATEVTAKYMKMAAASKSPPPQELDLSTENASTGAATTETGPESEPLSETPEPSMPIITDESILTEEDKSQLENAVWYRCENPFCKYTHFLDVHHIIDEKDGGTNKLENLIVLCPYCHDLAHRSEIPEKEMLDWISNRDERFKFKLEWHY